MKDITITEKDTRLEIVLRCKHAQEWPPAHVRLKQSFEQMRADGLIDEHKYEQLKTWDRICGLTEMDAGKCSECPYAMAETVQGWLPYKTDPATRRNLPFFARQHMK